MTAGARVRGGLARRAPSVGSASGVAGSACVAKMLERACDKKGRLVEPDMVRASAEQGLETVWARLEVQVQVQVQEAIKINGRERRRLRDAV